MSLFNMLGSLGSSLINSISQGVTNKQNIAYDKEVRSEEHQRSLEKMAEQQRLNQEQFDYEFQKEAEYNSPAAERARLEAAGLNPALMYQGGAGGSSVSASMQGVSTPSSSSGPGAIAKAPQIADMGTTLAQLSLLKSQKENVDADTKQKLSNIPETPEDGMTPQQLHGAILQNQYFREMYGAELKRIEKEIAEETKDDVVQMKKQELVELLNRIVNDRNVSAATVKQLEALVKKYGVEMSEIEERTKDMALTRSSRIAKLDSDAALSAAKAAQIEFDNKIQQDTGYRPGWDLHQLISGFAIKSILASYEFEDSLKEDIKNFASKLPELPSKISSKFGEWWRSISDENKQKYVDFVQNFLDNQKYF